MIISREVDINVNRYGLWVVIPVVQYDSGRQIIFNIVDAELPSDCTSNIFIKKPSGKSVYNTCTVSGNKVTVTLTNQSLSEYGFNDAQIQIIKGEEVVTSFSFILEVKQSDADNAVISRSESTFFQGIVNKAQAVAKTCTEVADSIPSDYSKLSSDVAVLNSNWVNISTTSELNSKLSALPSNKTLNVLAQGAVTAVLTNNMASSSGKGYITKISDTSADYSIMTGAGDFIFIGRYNFSDGEVSSVQKVPTRSEVDANTAAIATNKAAIANVKTDLLGGYKLVGYTASVVLNKAGEYIIPYPSGESFGTVYGILSATFLQGGYCLPNPPLTPSSTSPAYDISAAVAFRILSTGIAIYTGGAWGADSRDIYFVLICKA